MRRRGVTVLVGAILLALLVWQISAAKVPYVQLEPGPTVDTLGTADGKPGGKPVITVKGADTTKSKGQLRLTTVGVTADLTLLQALYGWWKDEDAVVPRELVYPPDQSEQEVDTRNAEDFKESQTAAETAALKKLGYPTQVAVVEVTPGFPAVGILEVGDIVTTVDGVAVSNLAELSEQVRARPVGTPRQLVVNRHGEIRTVAVPTAKGEDGNPRLGVKIEQKQPHPFELTIELDRIGGPSAGLMFALGIIDTLKPEDLTGGMIIAGTGTIDTEGKVGPIGGIPQKLVASKAAKAKAFLTPAANCAEALQNAQSGLPLVRVATLDEALSALETLRAGGVPPLCTR